MLAMFQVGGGEILLIALVALIVVGPEQLPSVMRKAGQYVNSLRAMTTGIRDEFMAGVDELNPNKWADGTSEKPVSQPTRRGDGSANNPIVPAGLADKEDTNPFASQAPANETEAEVVAAEAAERVKIAKREAAERAEAARAAARERLEAKAAAEADPDPALEDDPALGDDTEAEA